MPNPRWPALATAIAADRADGRRPDLAGPLADDGFARLLADLAAQARALGGSLSVVASARTPAAWRMAIAMRDAGVPGLRWTGEPDGKNPYAGLLAHADRIVCTPDSVNMLSEAAATRAPVFAWSVGTANGGCGGSSMPCALAAHARPRRHARAIRRRAAARNRASGGGGATTIDRCRPASTFHRHMTDADAPTSAHRRAGGALALDGLARVLERDRIVVLGVAIALAANQLAEDWSWRNKVADGQARLLGDTERLFVRSAEHYAALPCVYAQLDGLARRVMDSRHAGAGAPARGPRHPVQSDVRPAHAYPPLGTADLGRPRGRMARPRISASRGRIAMRSSTTAPRRYATTAWSQPFDPDGWPSCPT